MKLCSAWKSTETHVTDRVLRMLGVYQKPEVGAQVLGKATENQSKE